MEQVFPDAARVVLMAICLTAANISGLPTRCAQCLPCSSEAFMRCTHILHRRNERRVSAACPRTHSWQEGKPGRDP